MASDKRGAGVEVVEVILAIVLVTLGAATWATLCATSPPPRDPFDSRYEGWAYIVIPLFALVAGALRPRRARPWWWAAALLTPAALGVIVQDKVFYDDDAGSLRGIAAILVAAQWLLAVAAAHIGRWLRLG